jgi:hypothetical protein
MRNHPDTPARRACGLLAALAVCAFLAVGGCGAGAISSSGTAASTTGHAATPSSAPTAAGATTSSVHLTGNLCADAATANGGIRAITQSLVTNPAGRPQQVAKLLATVVASYTGLESEAPGALKAAFAKLASYYQTVESKLASGGGQLSLADIEPAGNQGLAPAIQQISSYLTAHCAA